MCTYGSLEYDVDDNIIQILKLLLDNNKVPEDAVRCGHGNWSSELCTDEWWNLMQQVNTAPNHHKAILYEIVNLIRPKHGYTRRFVDVERWRCVGFKK
jgi:hypothetical protein